MNEPSQLPISKEQAARLIFATAAPSSTQVARVHELMRRGFLQAAPDRHDLTTRQAVAEYLAAQEWKRQAHKRSTEKLSSAAARTTSPSRPAAAADLAAERASAGSGPGKRNAAGAAGVQAAATASERSSSAERKLKLVYRQLLVDYFMGVLVNRQATRATEAFRRAVAVSRVVLLLVLALLCGWTVHLAFRSGPRRAVEQWLAENRQAAELVRWQPAHPRPGGTAVRVEYRYQAESGKLELADRVFVVDGREVRSIVLPDERDDRLAGSRPVRPSPGVELKDK